MLQLHFLPPRASARSPSLPVLLDPGVTTSEFQRHLSTTSFFLEALDLNFFSSLSSQGQARSFHSRMLLWPVFVTYNTVLFIFI